MTMENDTERDSAYTRTYTVPVTHALLAVALTPTLDTLEAVRKLVAHELEAAYRAGQASSPSERHDALTAKLEHERILMRRAIGIVSDIQRLEGAVREVLDAHALGGSTRLVDLRIRGERLDLAELNAAAFPAPWVFDIDDGVCWTGKIYWGGENGGSWCTYDYNPDDPREVASFRLIAELRNRLGPP